MADFPEMKMLSEYEDEKGICKGAEVLGIILEALAEGENKKLEGEQNPFKLFSSIMRNSPRKMMDIFAVLSDVDPAEYHCNGAQATENMLKLCNDKILLGLFLLQGQMGDATSSGSASVSTEAP